MRDTERSHQGIATAATTAASGAAPRTRGRGVAATTTMVAVVCGAGATTGAIDVTDATAHDQEIGATTEAAAATIHGASVAARVHGSDVIGDSGRDHGIAAGTTTHSAMRRRRGPSGTAEVTGTKCNFKLVPSSATRARTRTTKAKGPGYPRFLDGFFAGGAAAGFLRFAADFFLAAAVGLPPLELIPCDYRADRDWAVDLCRVTRHAMLLVE